MSDCLVQGCAGDALHTMTFVIRAESWGEIEAEVAVCCPHFDRLMGQGERPFLDLTVTGVERVAS